jgi:hypothetical protein
VGILYNHASGCELSPSPSTKFNMSVQEKWGTNMNNMNIMLSEFADPHTKDVVVRPSLHYFMPFLP